MSAEEKRRRSHYTCYRCRGRLGVVRPLEAGGRQLTPDPGVKVSYRESGCLILICPETTCGAANQFTWQPRQPRPATASVLDSGTEHQAPGD